MEKQRKYFVCSVGKPGEDYVEDNLNRIINENAFVLHEDTKQKGSFSDIKEKDILILKYNNGFIGYGECTGCEILYEEDEDDYDCWNHKAYVKQWFLKNPTNPRESIVLHGLGYETISGGQYGTVKGVTDKFGLKKIYELDNKTILYQTIQKEIKEMEDLQNIIPILDYKKQIILQGPPGTGKTRLAKILAKDITKAVENKKPIIEIENFFQTFDGSISTNSEKRDKLNNLLSEFKTLFPVERIANLSLEDYAIGTGSNSSFCWWIERGLKPLGYYFPGSARSYLIYWNKEDQEYHTHYKHSSELRSVETMEEAFKIIASSISDLAQNEDLTKVSVLFGNSFILKVLHSYFPDKYFPVNSIKCLDNILKLIGDQSTGLDFIGKNLKVQEYYLQMKAKFNVDITNLEFMAFLFGRFDLKGDIEMVSESLIVKGEYKIIQFHPSYSYEDFVRGIVAETNEKGGLEYKVINKILADFAQKALDNRNAKFVLIIDEINRANLSSVLGELIYALEYRYDENNLEETTVSSLYGIKADKQDENADYTLCLPENLFIIGTMNTADRSVGHIDYAIRRRFAFVDVLPNGEPIKKFAKPLFQAVSELFINNYDQIDQPDFKPKRSLYLSTDFRPEDVWIGHSYFITDKDEEEGKKELRMKLTYEILPILKEYLKDGILNDKDDVKNLISGLYV